MVKKQEHKLYMGNLPTFLTEENVRQIVEKIGSLKSFNLVKDFVDGIPRSRVSRESPSLTAGLLFLRVQRPESDREGDKGA